MTAIGPLLSGVDAGDALPAGAQRAGAAGAAGDGRRGGGDFCRILLARYPGGGFWSGADSLYTLRADVQNRADTMNTVLDWSDRVLVISQGDDATRWYYYRYELTAQVVNGFGGFYGRLGETQDRWDSDFMNLVESENWTLYDWIRPSACRTRWSPIWPRRTAIIS